MGEYNTPDTVARDRSSKSVMKYTVSHIDMPVFKLSAGFACSVSRRYRTDVMQTYYHRLRGSAALL